MSVRLAGSSVSSVFTFCRSRRGFTEAEATNKRVFFLTFVTETGINGAAELVWLERHRMKDRKQLQDSFQDPNELKC